MSDDRKLGLLIKRWRIKHGLSRVEAVDAINNLGVDISYGYLNKLESGNRSLSSASVNIREAIRQVLGISRDEWRDATGLYVPPLPDQPADETMIPGGLVLVSVVGAANGGKPTEYALPVKRELVRPSTRAFQVEGESMNDGTDDGIRDGDWVLVDTALTECLNGKVYLIEIIGDGMAVKRLRKLANNWIFLSDNPDGETFEDSEVRVVGQVYGKVSFGEVR